MIELQHINSLEPLQPIEIDYAVLDLQMKLKTNLSWLSHSYGRAYRIDKQGEERRFILPEVYVGNTDGKYSLMPVTPDNDKFSSSFFVIDSEKQESFEQNSINYLSWNVGLIFWVNLEMINENLSKTEDFTQNLIKEVRNVITTKLLGVGYKVEVFGVDREPNQVFKEFILQDRRYVVMPFMAFRFNLKFTLREDCKLVSDRGAAITNNVTQFEIRNYIMPKLDFKTDDFLFLSDEQKNDLITRLNE